MTVKATPGMRLTGTQHLVTRPYAGVEVLSDALSMCQLVLPEGRFEPGPVSLPPESLPITDATLEIYLDLARICGSLEELEIPVAAVSVAVVAYGNVVAASSIIANVRLEDFDSPLAVSLDGHEHIFKSPNGFDLRAFLYLSKPLKPKGFRPTTTGTWLAHAEFKIGPYSTLSRFCPTPLDDQLRGHYGLPRECMTYVRIGDGVIDTDSLEEEVDVFVDLNVLRLLQENPSDPLSAYMQLELVILTLVAVITKVSSLTQDGSGPYAFSSVEELDTPAMNLVKSVAAVTHLSTSALLSIATADPGLLRAAAEGYVKTLKTASAALREIS